MSGNYSIYTGYIWTEYTSGNHILTLSHAAAGVLQSTIPIWITFVGSACWNIVMRLYYHCLFLQDKDAITLPASKWQTHLMIRNSAGDFTILGEAFSFLKSWGWRGRIWRRILPITFLSLFYWATWTVWGIVSFYIWQDRVPLVGLIKSPNCGYLAFNNTQSTVPFRSTGVSQTILAETWVSQCYGETSTDSAACNLYPSQSLNVIPTDEVKCPFTSPDICITTNSTPHQMDSGLINSHFDLGMNAPPSERVSYRKVTTCSPVHTTPFAQVLFANQTDEAAYYSSDTVLQRFFFGPINNYTAYTYEYNTWAPWDGFGYQIESISYTPGPSGENQFSAWTPNATFFNQTSADLSLFFLSQNHVVYHSPSYHQLYLATNFTPVPIAGKVEQYFVSTYDINALGCTDQHQICDPNRADDDPLACTPMLAWLQLSEAIWNMELSARQVAAAERIVGNLVMTNTVNSVSGRNAAALLASQTVSELVQTQALPADQWHREVENWFSVSLAKLQRNIIDFAGGPSDPTLSPYVQYPVDEELARMCGTQTILLPSDSYSNFNFDAIIGITIVGVFLIVLGLRFEGLFASFLKWRSKPGERDWVLNGPYQLQRLAYADRVTHPWDDEEGDLPRTSEELPPIENLRAPIVPLQQLPAQSPAPPAVPAPPQQVNVPQQTATHQAAALAQPNPSALQNPPQSTPTQISPIQSTLTQLNSAQSAPSQPASAQTTVNQSTPAHLLPSQPTPAQPSPTQSISAQSTPSQSNSVQSTSGQSTAPLVGLSSATPAPNATSQQTTAQPVLPQHASPTTP